MVYKRVVINGEVYPGEDVKDVIFADKGYWVIKLKDGRELYATGNITVEELHDL